MKAIATETMRTSHSQNWADSWVLGPAQIQQRVTVTTKAPLYILSVHGVAVAISIQSTVLDQLSSEIVSLYRYLSLTHTQKHKSLLMEIWKLIGSGMVDCETVRL